MNFIPTTFILYQRQHKTKKVIFGQQVAYMKTWNCLIVDDEDLDRLMVVAFAKKFPQLSLIAACKSAEEALEVLQKNTIDILFLDIDMPSSSGVDLRKKAMTVPVCIFITGHAEYAVESFELDTLDYIMKPLKFDRFERAMQRIEQFLEIKEKANLFELSFGENAIYVKEGTEKSKVNLYDILYLEALKDYTLLVTPQKKHCVWSNLGSLIKQEPFQSFTRVHRSFAIQKQFVKKISAQEIILSNNTMIPVGRSYKDIIKTLL